MAESIFKKIGSVVATTLENTKAEMTQMVGDRMDTEIININTNIETIISTMKKEDLHRILDTRII